MRNISSSSPVAGNVYWNCLCCYYYYSCARIQVLLFCAPTGCWVVASNLASLLFSFSAPQHYGYWLCVAYCCCWCCCCCCCCAQWLPTTNGRQSHWQCCYFSLSSAGHSQNLAHKRTHTGKRTYLAHTHRLSLAVQHKQVRGSLTG